MKTAIITVKTEASLKRRAEQFARSTGISLSDMVNLSLRHVVATGRIVIEEPFVPNAKTRRSLNTSLKSIKVGKALSPVFNTAAEMDIHLDNL